MNRPRLLLLSHVLPFPGSAGQEQRVRETLAAARTNFHVTFATAQHKSRQASIATKLAPLCDEVLFLDARYDATIVHRVWYHAIASGYAMRTGLKSSNFVIGKLEFSPDRIRTLLQGRTFDVALFEYWHASDATQVLQERGVRCVLDMHDILWKGREQRLLERKRVPNFIRDWSVNKYRNREERAWQAFDGIIAINREERDYVQEQLGTRDVRVFYAPMGTDLHKWNYRWSPAAPPRVAYYGSLGTAHNRRSAMQCYREIMPLIWQTHPKTQLWLVGSNPSQELQALTADPRVVVTGFVQDVQDTLASMTAVLCPWVGTYGFRSRLVEVMALGVPVIASPDAVAGMGLETERGLFLARDAAEFASNANRLLEDAAFAQQQSAMARLQTEQLFSLENTYHRLMHELESWLTTGTKE